MTATIPYNPFLTTTTAGFFASVSDGFVQGIAEDDPSYRNWLAGAVLAASETLPLWGGVGIYENLNPLSIPLANDSSPIGPIVGRATTLTAGASGQLAGFSVFNQAYANPISTSSNVPLVASGGAVNFFRLGSQARIPLAVSSNLIAALGSGSTLTQVSWDFVNQCLIPYAAPYGTGTITGATWASTAGGQATFTVGTNYTTELSAGDWINVSGVVSTGGTGLGYNGSFQVVSVTSTTVVVSLPAASSPGTYSSGGTVAAGGGALPVKILKVQATNCKTVSYSAASNSANWNNNGACALVLI